jgi:hypothetical protein
MLCLVTYLKIGFGASIYIIGTTRIDRLYSKKLYNMNCLEWAFA